MRRIPKPQCTCCRKADAAWESERWPTVQLCYTCARDLAQFIIQEIRVVNGNPILIELVKNIGDGRKEREDGISHRTWLQNPDRSFSECWVNERDESAMDFENPLDILHQL